ncbi:MAG: DNA-binding protein WhiA [Oscillospiraceae bacterium]|nr:DNA-binding protein WhiA [Oscillospiraceae bacterium]
MSFSNDVKSEIACTVTDSDKKFACLYGMIIFCKQYTRDTICLQTESDVVARLFPQLMSEVFHDAIHIEKEMLQRKNKTALYSFQINGQELVSRVSSMMKINPDKREIDIKNIDNNNLANFLAGVFLSCGSVTNPNNEYHLEFVVATGQLYSDLSLMLGSIGLEGKKVIRKNSHILYFKESENIEDILTFMGAQQSTLELINVKILKDVRNRVNRISNCDLANCNKTIEAALKQKMDIELIASSCGLDSLPVTLQEIAAARINHPELSLKELGEILDPPIGRSGVNHRLKRITKIADELRQKNQK